MPKKLYKIEQGRVFYGVCGGIGKYFKIDPTVIRLIWIILTFGSVGSGIIVYILAAVIMPEM